MVALQFTQIYVLSIVQLRWPDRCTLDTSNGKPPMTGSNRTSSDMLMKHSILKLTLLATAISSSMAAHAQSDETSKVERIQVTGSHIKRTDMEGPSPVTSLSADDIANTGVTDLIGLFTKLPAAGQGTFSTQGNSSDGTSSQMLDTG